MKNNKQSKNEETHMQDLREVSGRLEGCACSYGTSSMVLTSKTSHTHTHDYTDIDISTDRR